MSAFDRLPNELIVKIYLHLRTDLQSIIRLIATCKRLSYIARDLLPKQPEWIDSRLISLNPASFRSDFVSYSTLIEQLKSIKYVPFNTISFAYTKLRISICLGDDKPPPLTYMKLRFEHIVELRLINCKTTSIWLTTVLNNLPHISYLTLKETSVVVAEQTPIVIHKKLKELRLLYDRSFDDELLFQLFGNLSPALLDFTGTWIVCDRRVKQRYYGPQTAPDFYSKLTLTLHRILSFIDHHMATLKRLILDGTPIKDDDLLQLAQNERLQHLSISALRCPQITKKSVSIIESSGLNERVQASGYILI